MEEIPGEWLLAGQVSVRGGRGEALHVSDRAIRDFTRVALGLDDL